VLGLTIFLSPDLLGVPQVQVKGGTDSLSFGITRFSSVEIIGYGVGAGVASFGTKIVRRRCFGAGFGLIFVAVSSSTFALMLANSSERACNDPFESSATIASTRRLEVDSSRRTVDSNILPSPSCLTVKAADVKNDAAEGVAFFSDAMLTVRSPETSRTAAPLCSPTCANREQL